MNAADRRALERELADSRRARDEADAERQGYERALVWAETFGEGGIAGRAEDLGDEADRTVTYYDRQIERLEDDLARADVDADHRAFERDSGAKP